LTAFTQIDSLKLVQVKAWQLSRMIDEVRLYRVCDSVVTKLDSTVQSLKTALNAGQQLINLRTAERNLKAREANLCDSIASNSNVIHKSELKAERRKGYRKLWAGAVIGFVLAVLLI
jgi:hypothetical protein